MDKGSSWRFGTTAMSCGDNLMFRAVVIAWGNNEQSQILSNQDDVIFLATRVFPHGLSEVFETTNICMKQDGHSVRQRPQTRLGVCCWFLDVSSSVQLQLQRFHCLLPSSPPFGLPRQGRVQLELMRPHTFKVRKLVTLKKEL